MAAADALFQEHPYHQITMGTIAKELGWSRSNLYKYAATQEEIFLALHSAKNRAWLEDLCAALAQVPGFEPVPESTPEPEQPVSVNPVVTMIDTAILLLDTDAAANKAQAVSLISGASTLIGETNPGATTLLTSVVTLLDVDAAGNAASVKMVLESVKAML